VCEACDGDRDEGRCVVVTGAPHGDRSCEGAGTACAGACAGDDRTTCSYPAVTTVCDSQCSEGEQTDRSCDGHGHCTASSTHSCANLLCADASVCKTECRVDSDCREGFACNAQHACEPASVCIDAQTARSADGTTSPCTPYTCGTDGQCKSHCASVRDCVSGFACDAEGRCRLAEAAVQQNSGCQVGKRAARRRSRWTLLACMAAFAWMRLRRRRLA
jgi:hypothetical protein